MHSNDGRDKARWATLNNWLPLKCFKFHEILCTLEHFISDKTSANGSVILAKHQWTKQCLLANDLSVCHAPACIAISGYKNFTKLYIITWKFDAVKLSNNSCWNSQMTMMMMMKHRNLYKKLQLRKNFYLSIYSLHIRR